jgi:hypothetical protein
LVCQRLAAVSYKNRHFAPNLLELYCTMMHNHAVSLRSLSDHVSPAVIAATSRHGERPAARRISYFSLYVQRNLPTRFSISKAIDQSAGGC